MEKNKIGVYIGFMFFIMIIFTQNINANPTMIPIVYESTITFNGDRDFDIHMPGEQIRHVSWGVNNTPLNTSFSYIFYHILDEEKYCAKQLTQINEYQKISLGLTDVLSVCTGAINTFNQSSTFMGQIAEAKSDRVEYERLWKIEEDNRKSFEEKYKDLKNSTKDYKSDYDNCKSKLVNQQNIVSDKKRCETELTALNKTKNSTNFIFGLVGLFLGHYFWPKKKEQIVSSEHSEAGVSGDEIRHEDPETTRRFDERDFQEQ